MIRWNITYREVFMSTALPIRPFDVVLRDIYSSMESVAKENLDPDTVKNLTWIFLELHNTISRSKELEYLRESVLELDRVFNSTRVKETLLQKVRNVATVAKITLQAQTPAPASASKAPSSKGAQRTSEGEQKAAYAQTASIDHQEIYDTIAKSSDDQEKQRRWPDFVRRAIKDKQFQHAANAIHHIRDSQTKNNLIAQIPSEEIHAILVDEKRLQTPDQTLVLIDVIQDISLRNTHYKLFAEIHIRAKQNFFVYEVIFRKIPLELKKEFLGRIDAKEREKTILGYLEAQKYQAAFILANLSPEKCKEGWLSQIFTSLIGSGKVDVAKKYLAQVEEESIKKRLTELFPKATTLHKIDYLSVDVEGIIGEIAKLAYLAPALSDDDRKEAMGLIVQLEAKLKLLQEQLQTDSLPS